MSPANAMTNIAFRAQEIINIVAPNMKRGVTNFFLGYETELNCTNSPHETCKLKVIENGQFILVNDHHELGETITVGRNNCVLGVLKVQNSRININNECVFGSFPLNENNEHVGVLLLHGTRPDMVKSEFLHIELGTTVLGTTGSLYRWWIVFGIGLNPQSFGISTVRWRFVEHNDGPNVSFASFPRYEENSKHQRIY